MPYIFSQTWKIYNIDFHLVVDNIFNIPVDAIVNSEQTDFILSWNTKSISGQIRNRFGALVQDELFAHTEGKVFHEGKILKTGPVGDYKGIYHAGFHLPWKYLDFEVDESSQTDYLKIIRSCIRQILDDLDPSGIKSVAFPLIGTGIFQLDPSLLAYEFILELFAFAESNRLTEHKHVWLVIYTNDKEELPKSVLNSSVQALIDRTNNIPEFDPLNLCVSYLDEFEKIVMRSYHPQWSAWLLVRYAELITGYIFYNLASSCYPPLCPDSVIKEDSPITFGLLRSRTSNIISNSNKSNFGKPWTSFLAEIINKDLEKNGRLQRLVDDRNDIAHGRASRPPIEIYKDLKNFLNIEEWHEKVMQQGKPEINQLKPWIAEAHSDNKELSETGVLERWNKKYYLYLIPSNGQTFTFPLA